MILQIMAAVVASTDPVQNPFVPTQQASQPYAVRNEQAVREYAERQRRAERARDEAARRERDGVPYWEREERKQTDSLRYTKGSPRPVSVLDEHPVQVRKKRHNDRIWESEAWQVPCNPQYDNKGMPGGSPW